MSIGPILADEYVGAPASGAWKVGDPVGDRQFLDLGPVALENGAALEVRVAYETWGELADDASNAVLVLHALTGDSHVTGPAGPGHPTPGWWDEMVGPGKAVDTDHWFVVAPNALGGCQGTTGPSSDAPDGAPWGSRFPHLTVRDQVGVEDRLRAALGIERWALVMGGSLGGMRAVEHAVTFPERTRRLALLASCAAASADQIGWNSAQIAAIEADPGFRGGDYYDREDGRGPHQGLALARRIAHLTYRSSPELQVRFGNQTQTEAPVHSEDSYFQVESYLDHHGDKLVGRFDAGSYRTLARAMNTHDVGRGRGGVHQALGRISARTLVVAVDSDRLFPLEQSRVLEAGLRCEHDFHIVHSVAGHDGFLVEADTCSAAVTDLLAST